MAQYKIQAALRTDTPTALRRTGGLPAVLYGHNIENSVLAVEAKAVQKAVQEAGTTSLVNLVIGDETHAVLIREVQRHPVTDAVLHVDFYKVRLDEEIQARVPVSFEGSSRAVRELGGVLVRTMDEVNVEAFPQHLPHNLVADISKLEEFDQALLVKDLKLPPNVTLLHKGDEILALVQAPRSEEELAALSQEVKEEVETVEGVKEKEEGEQPEQKEEAKDGTENERSAKAR